MINKLEILFIITTIVTTITGVSVLYFDFNKELGVSIMIVTIIVLIVGSFKFVERKKSKK